jgi:5-methyltetrahydropteroyltriglutamate--homocysteine methyltransferase
LKRLAARGGTPTYRRPRAVAPLPRRARSRSQDDVASVQRSAATRCTMVEPFMNAASPGVIALFQPNDYYPDHESYLMRAR